LRKDSNDASEQLVGCKAGNLWQYEPFIDDLTGHIVGAEYNAQKTLSIVPVMVMACVKPIPINYAIFLNPIATNAVKTAQIHSWCMRISPGLIKPSETQTLHVPKFQW